MTCLDQDTLKSPTVAKTNKTRGLLKRICYDVRDESIKKLLYCALIRPKLEFGSSVWSPYTIKHRALIENVQRRATKFILNYPQNMTYNERLIKLNLLPLEHCRETSDLLLFFFSPGTVLYLLKLEITFVPSSHGILRECMAPVITNYLLTESEVFTGKSRAETLQY